jgi:DUF917 family protein
LATTPNLIVIVELDNGLALQTEDLKYGIRVAVLVLPGEQHPNHRVAQRHLEIFVIMSPPSY